MSSLIASFSSNDEKKELAQNSEQGIWVLSGLFFLHGKMGAEENFH